MKRKGGRGDEREEKGEKRGREEEKWRKKKGKRVVTCIMNAFLFPTPYSHTHTQSVSLAFEVQSGCCKL